MAAKNVTTLIKTVNGVTTMIYQMIVMMSRVKKLKYKVVPIHHQVRSTSARSAHRGRINSCG